MAKLETIFIGTGRDGTVSIAEMVRELFDAEGKGRTVMHEYMARELLHLFSQFIESNDEQYRDEARKIISECPYNCIVGAGTAFWIPQFREIYGKGLKIVQIFRENRTKCVSSLAENCNLFPLAYGYYSDSPLATTKRPSAFHFGEMSKKEWNILSLDSKLGWYYDKTHELISKSLPMFDMTWKLLTEEISSYSGRSTIAMAVGITDNLPSAKHLNPHAFTQTFPEESREKVQWLLSRLDLQSCAMDETYPLQYFTNKFIAWSGYQINRSEVISSEYYRSKAFMADTLDTAESILEEAISDIHRLKADLDGQQ